MALIMKDANGLVSLANKSDKWAVYNTKAAAEEALANDELAEGMMVGVVSTTDTPFNPDYSTTEIKTGAKWIDGKPIYRKAGYKSTISNSEVILDASLTTSYVDVLITAKASTTYHGKMIVSDWNSANECLCLAVDTTGLIQTSNTLHLTDVTGGLYWIVEYTKTGD